MGIRHNGDDQTVNPSDYGIDNLNGHSTPGTLLDDRQPPEYVPSEVRRHDIYNGRINYIQLGTIENDVTAQIQFATEADRTKFLSSLRNENRIIHPEKGAEETDAYLLPTEKQIYPMAATGQGFGVQIASSDHQVMRAVSEVLNRSQVDTPKWMEITESLINIAKTTPAGKIAEAAWIKRIKSGPSVSIIPTTVSLFDSVDPDFHRFEQIEPSADRLPFAQIHQPTSLLERIEEPREDKPFPRIDDTAGKGRQP